MGQALLTFYSRYHTFVLLAATALLIFGSLLWYLPGAAHAGSVAEYHAYSFADYRFTNVISVFTNRELHQFDQSGTVRPGIEYPALLNLLINATVWIAVAGNVAGYLWANLLVILPAGLVLLLIIKRWPGSEPWMFAFSPVLFVFAFYNWDLVALLLGLGGLLLLKESTEHPDPGRPYNLRLELLGFTVLALGCWFKLFPIVFFGAALIDRARRGLWREAGMGVGIFAVLSLLINVPMMLADFDGWSFFYQINQHRDTEPTIWYWLIGGMDPAIMTDDETTDLVNRLSPLVVGIGGLVIAVLAWRSPRRGILLPAGTLLLAWWLSFNKIYDPNFDLWLLVLLAALGAPVWLYVGFVLMSLFWWIAAFEGLTYWTIGQPQAAAWHLGHTLFFALLLRLVVLGAIIFWTGRELMTVEQPAELREAGSEESTVSLQPSTVPRS